MTMRMALFSASVAVLLLATIAIVWLALRRISQRSPVSWQSLVGRLKAVNRDSITRVALDLESEGQQENSEGLSDSEIWDLVGGLEGLKAMEQNCDVLIDMAAYVQRWHPEAVAVAEELRISARQIKWHIARIQGATKTGKTETTFASYAQNAVAIYYAMTKTLLQLYQVSNLPESAALRNCI